MLILAAMVAAALDQPPAPVSGSARASDGDSFRLGPDRVRLLGLDAPELSQDCFHADGQSWPCGRAARDRMARLLAGGPVHCRPEDVDQYGRLLATCQVSGHDIGAMMVAEGLAVSSGRYWSEEANARRDRAGIWAGDFDAPRQWRDDHPQGRGLLGWLATIGL
ncbi:thermonuclease family protein [Devosia oryziradicis]|uniref:Thermonuclease family protein n=1 Tax=Devosia oryziradicis TaxID=2801335 RepID=A0ABX7BVJ6_9HYPH|nr:thermonuclease family protein [Devosia oryziradicis]QQR35567.1 thermonuclease family protein [Devosia oryziradicis]